MPVKEAGIEDQQGRKVESRCETDSHSVSSIGRSDESGDGRFVRSDCSRTEEAKGRVQSATRKERETEGERRAEKRPLLEAGCRVRWKRDRLERES